MKRRHLLQNLLKVALLAAPLPGAAQSNTAPVLAALRQGGLVIYFRHSLTVRTGQPDDDLSNCARQRNLTQAGQQLATDIGEAFRELRIPVGAVLSSPYCRCVDTARLAFGQAEVAAFLETNGDAGDAQEQKRLAQLAALLGTVPASGGNTVLVAHGNNLGGLTVHHGYPSLRIEEAEAVILRPRPRGPAQVLARVPGAQWRNLG